ncbi:UBA domain-containing protein 3 [Neolecta irregularis DAH-3]|uniref:UBA domain-containing protein 3 n=1 Tax=Neolecta irregularis (strain DAH-3) TaxID=1198029 RepID=A0A1U7LMB5_NEOID|nr:UBA domain-containing protein 3 [Neolecta irregularis DAH-3]|eukprot:OLL23787.1 UBA domain-containing protein 3 [Neolecta irregularis DAH-3]
MRDLGNIKSNAIFNSDPLRHPMPVGYMNDDEVMERYIRDKYERKAFQVSDPNRYPLRKPSLAQSERNQSPQSSEYINQLLHLKEMGFSNATKNLEILKLKNGDLPSTIEVLVALQQPPSPLPKQCQPWNPFDEPVAQLSSTRAPSTVVTREPIQPSSQSISQPLNPFMHSRQPLNTAFTSLQNQTLQTNLNPYVLYHNQPQTVPNHALSQQHNASQIQLQPPQSQTQSFTQPRQMLPTVQYQTHPQVSLHNLHQPMHSPLPFPQQQIPNQPVKQSFDKEAIMSLFNKPVCPPQSQEFNQNYQQ